MAALLAKFRIDFSSVLVIPGKNIIQFKITFYLTLLLDVTKRASEESRTKLNAKLAELPAGTIPEVGEPPTRQLRTIFYQEELITMLTMLTMIIIEHKSRHDLLPGGAGQQQGKDQ